MCDNDDPAKRILVANKIQTLIGIQFLLPVVHASKQTPRLNAIKRTAAAAVNRPATIKIQPAGRILVGWCITSIQMLLHPYACCCGWCISAQLCLLNRSKSAQQAKQVLLLT